MTSDSLQSISGLVAEKFKTAIDAGDAFYYESDVHVITPSNSDNSSSKPVPWQVRIVPALLKKPKANSLNTEDSERPKQNSIDVFAPPYVPNLLVKELGDYTALLNKFCVLPRHFLLVTREFVKQEKPPSPDMLEMVYRMIVSHMPSSNNAELLGFFNCGPNSGASQPHCHFQLVELTPPENGLKAVPIENMLSTTPSPDERKSDVLGIDVPWRHFVARLNPPSLEPKQLGQYFGTRFSELLDAMFTLALEEGDEGLSTSGPPSFNILLTRNFMHVIPRSKETFDLKEAGWGEYGAGGHPPKYTGTLSVNALGMCN